MRDADAEAVTRVRGELDELAGELAVEALPDGFWPIGGALLVNLRNVLAALDAVADAQPVEVPLPALSQPSVRSRL